MNKDAQMVTKYKDMVYRLFKSDELKISLDEIQSPDISLFSILLSDFKVFTVIQFGSFRCSG